MPNACPFNNKQFLQKIELGQQKPKEFMDKMMETVISDLSDLKKPKSNHIFKIFQYNRYVCPNLNIQNILLFLKMFCKKHFSNMKKKQ